MLQLPHFKFTSVIVLLSIFYCNPNNVSFVAMNSCILFSKSSYMNPLSPESFSVCPTILISTGKMAFLLKIEANVRE